MIEKKTTRPAKLWLVVAGVAIVMTVALSIGVAFASRAGQANQLTNEVDNSPLAGPPPAQPAKTQCTEAYMSLEPESGAPCNGCSVTAGTRFVLDLVAHTGQGNVTAEQSYMGFSAGTLQVVNAEGTDCTPSATVSSDPTTFDAELQNEVCNGPGPCDMRGQKVDPGSIAYAAGALQHCPNGCTGDISVARVALCATKAGDAAIRWQFTPKNRQTQLVDISNKQMSTATCFADYKLSVTPAR